MAGHFTLLTGIGSTKTKSYKYRADYAYKDNDSTYHCLIDYLEDVTADRERVKDSDGSVSMQSTDFRLSARYADPKSQNVITLGEDTLAIFNITNKNEAIALTSYDQMWDGTDSTTIVPLPASWNNKFAEKDIVITGKMGADTFTMKSWKGKRIKEYYINDQLAVIFQGSSEPVSGLLFHPLSTRQLKLFTILSSLPYDYFNETYFH